MKRKSAAHLKSELWNKLRPEVDLPTLANDISEFLHKHAGKSAGNPNVANNLAAYLTQKYSIGGKKRGDLGRLIEVHTDDLAAFLDTVFLKEVQSLAKILGQRPRTKKKPRRKPQTEAERIQRQTKSKNRYESRRREYRDALIEEQFGTQLPNAFNQYSFGPSSGPCLDILFSGGGVRMAGCVDSLENLFGIDRHRLPKSLPHKRSGRNQSYGLPAFTECLIHLLAKRDGGEQWPPQPEQRAFILTGIIERARRFSPELAAMMAEKLRSYLP